MSHDIDIAKLSAEDRLALLELIWDSLDPDAVPLTEAQREELDRRIADFEGDSVPGIAWEAVLERLRGRREPPGRAEGRSSLTQ